MTLELDPWQQEVLETEGNLVLRSGRQTGKSTVISIKASEYAVSHAKKLVLIVAAVERQAYLLFEKTLSYLVDNYKKLIKTGKERPTKHVINLTNGSRIMCLPTGLTGYGIRGYTTDLLIVDEAAFVRDEVFRAVSPQLAVTGGKLILLSTPFGKEGYFYERFDDSSFKTFHVSSEDCPRIDKEFLKREKTRMSRIQYAQEYLGEFVDELLRFFPTELIKSCMKFGESHHSTKGDKFLGVDVAQMGGDETVLISLARVKRHILRMIDMDISTRTRLTETIARIKMFDTKWDYRRIYVDSGGLGVGVCDTLLEDEQTRRKIVEINNASRSIEWAKKRKKRLMKEDLYTNLLRLMEQNKVVLFNNPEIMQSLSSVQCEYIEGKMKIYGRYTHIAEALVRAAWCMRDKRLNIWVR